MKMEHLYCIVLSLILRVNSIDTETKSLEELELAYEDEKNSMIAITEADEMKTPFEDFYDELDSSLKMEQSMNMIFFGPASSFFRLDAESILHILTHTKKDLIPVSRALLAWDILTDGKTSAFLQGRELKAFGSLLNYIPEEDLFYLNMGDSSVFRYFAGHKIDLSDRKFGILISSYRRYFGTNWYKNSLYINELGYLLCGFPTSDLEKISPLIFKELTIDVLNKLDRCSLDQLQALYHIATRYTAYGEPYKWSSHEIVRLGGLFKCIRPHQISSIRLQAITAISHRVMACIDQHKLQFFTKPQILKMNPQTRRIYILRMQLKYSLDTSQIPKKIGEKLEMSKTCFAAGLIWIISLCSNM